MLDFQQKRKIRKVLYSRLTLALLAVAIFFLARSTYHIYSKEALSEENYASVKKAYDDLTTRQATLGKEIDRLGTDAGVEEEIRTKFSVAKPGETIVTVVNSTSSPDAGRATGQKSLWQRFLGLFR